MDLLANGEGSLAVKRVGSDSSNLFANDIVRSVLEFATLGNRDLVGLEGLSDLRILRAGEDSSNRADFASLLKGEREPVLLLRGELLLNSKAAKSVFQTLRPETLPRERTALVPFRAAATPSS